MIFQKTRAHECYKENPNLSNLIPQAFAIVREASMRTLGLSNMMSSS